jgi:hypothetical protein
MTVRVVASIVRPDSEPSSTYSDSGVVTTMWRRTAAHARPLVLRRVAGAHQRADVDVGQPARSELAADARERNLEILPDVVRQRFQWRHVDDGRLVGEARGEPFDDERVDGRQERGERLPRTCRRGDQHVAPRADQRPGAGLRRRRRRKLAGEPGGDRRVERVGHGLFSHFATVREPPGGNAINPVAYQGALR